MAMVDLLRRIYKAELIKPESRNYLLDLMARCQTGKNRIKALLPDGVPSSTRPEPSMASPTMSASSPCPTATAIAVAIFTRGGTDRPRTIAEAARAIYDGFKSRLYLAVRLAGLRAQ